MAFSHNELRCKGLSSAAIPDCHKGKGFEFQGRILSYQSMLHCSLCLKIIGTECCKVFVCILVKEQVSGIRLY